MNKSLKHTLQLLVFNGLALSATAPARAQSVREANKINQEQTERRAEERDYNAEFMVAAASSNMLEVALGQLAQQKGIATEVRDWGKQMEAAHGQAEQGLRTIAFKYQITLPGAMSDDAREVYKDVDDRKYLGFDKKYLRTLKEQHERDLKLYTEAADKLTNPALQQYAARMLPVLHRHEQTLAGLYERASDRK